MQLVYQNHSSDEYRSFCYL